MFFWKVDKIIDKWRQNAYNVIILRFEVNGYGIYHNKRSFR